MMNHTHFCFLSVFMLISLSQCTSSHDTDSYVDPYFNGVNSLGKMSQNPYLTAGDKSYIVGTQNGLFPDIGKHVQGEMGGIWTHPIKLADGFWLKIVDTDNNDEKWLSDSEDFITYPFGNTFIYAPVFNGIDVVRFQFAPDEIQGVIIEYVITNLSETERNLNIDFLLKTDISPVWFSTENNIFDYPDIIRWDKENGLFTARDSINHWFAVWGSSNEVKSYSLEGKEPFFTKGNGKTGLISSVLKLAQKEQTAITYVVTGSLKDEQEALSKFHALMDQRESLLEKKKDRYKDILRRSKLTIPDNTLETAYNWVKINTRWLEMDLHGYGKFLGAGAIEYPWLFGCDNSYALQGVLATGNFELAKSTLTILKNVSEKVNGNGQIIHEMSSNGFVYNTGNTQETAHFIVTVWKTFLWTGDISFLQDIYPYIKKGIHWLTVDMDTNQNLFPEGYGIVEVSGLNAELIDVAVYTQQALEAASRMAALFNEQSISTEYAGKAAMLKEKINAGFWDENEGIYCDFFGTKEQAISVANGAIRQIHLGSSDVNEENIRFFESLITYFNTLPDSTQQGWFTNKNWVITTPMETAIAPVDKAIRSLDKIRNEHCGEYGPYLSAVEKRRMMTIATGVQAVSEAQYGRMEECLWYMNKITSTLSRTLPGSINEMMPDYGCPAQAWTIYGLAVPLVMHIFGITPDAYHKNVIIAPSVPESWNEMSLENQQVGSNRYDIQMNIANGKTTYIIKSEEKDWNNVLRIKGLSGKSYEHNGKTITATSDDILLTGTKNMITYAR